MRTALSLSTALCALLLLTACEREEREFRPEAEASGEAIAVTLSTIAPGPVRPGTPAIGREYEENAYHVSEGKRLYTWFNCNGCHAHGGGDSGPALMDDTWIYGAAIENIYSTIEEGRPNGMPSFRGLIPDEQVWQIAAYIRSMGRYVRKDVAPGRKDDLNARPAENRLPRATPAPGGDVPPSAETPQ